MRAQIINSTRSYPHSSKPFRDLKVYVRAFLLPHNSLTPADLWQISPRARAPENPRYLRTLYARARALLVIYNVSTLLSINTALAQFDTLLKDLAPCLCNRESFITQDALRLVSSPLGVL